MNQELYETLCDDAQQLALHAENKMKRVQEMLLKAGHPGVRLSNRDVIDICNKFKEIREFIDKLPAEINQ